MAFPANSRRGFGLVLGNALAAGVTLTEYELRVGISMIGWVQWIVLAGCTLGFIFGAVAEKKTDLLINGAVAIVAMLRLILGQGII